MSNRRIAWGSGTAVVVAAVNSALINELHAGWLWWAAAAAATGAGAALAFWLSGSSPGDSTPEVEVQAGGVYAGRDIAGRVRTRSWALPRLAGGERAKRHIGPGAIAAGRDISEDAAIDTTGDRAVQQLPPGEGEPGRLQS